MFFGIGKDLQHVHSDHVFRWVANRKTWLIKSLISRDGSHIISDSNLQASGVACFIVYACN